MIAMPVFREAPAERFKLPPRRLGPLLRPVLRFTPPAWSKLLSWGDRGTLELCVFGITLADDPLLVTEVRLVRQFCTADSLIVDDEALAEFFDEQVDLGRRPAQFARVWIRIGAAGRSAPSRLDEETCARCFGRTDWMVWCRLGRGGPASARLRFHVGPGGSLRLPVKVDFRFPFAASAVPEWEREYREHVLTEDPF